MRTTSERKVILASCLGHFFSHYIMLVFPALVIALAQEFQTSLADVLEISFLGYLLYGLGALPAGLLTDRFGARAILFICLFGCAGGAFWAARAQDLDELFLALAVIGVSSSLYHPAGMTLISRNVSQAGSALGTNGIYGNLGIALAPFMAGAISSAWSWRAAYTVSAVALLVVAFLVLLISPEDQRHESKSRTPTETRGMRAPIFTVLIVGLAIAAAGLAYRSSSITLPAYFEDRSGPFMPVVGAIEAIIELSSRKTVAATLLTSLAYLVGMAGQALGGRIADRRDLRLAYAAFHLLALPFLGLLFVLPDWALPLAAAGYIFFAMGMQPIENSLVARLATARYRGLSYGLKFTLTFGVGSLAVYAVAAIQRDFSLPSVFLFTALVTAMTSVFALFFYLLTRKNMHFAVSGPAS